MNCSDKSLLESLRRLSQSDILPMHMPGHKRNTGGALGELGAAYDITEIDGFDDLHDPSGIIKNIEDSAAALWGAQRSRILVGGSTCGILAAIYAATHRGDSIIMARGCHRSVYHAVELCGLNPVYIGADRYTEFGFALSVDLAEIEKAIAENPDSTAVVITSPTYEGIISDVAEIARMAHGAGMILIVDEAHGAHLGMGGFSDGAVKCGADIVVQSLHKTLCCLTQTAVLHRCSDRVDDSTTSHAIDIFETSSPSYLLMASIDECIRSINSSGLDGWHSSISAVAEKLKKMNNLHLPTKTTDGEFDFDISKLTVYSGRISGFSLADILRSQYRIEVEMAAPGYVVAMSGMGDTVETLDRFSSALLDIDSREELFSESVIKCPEFVMPERCMPVGAAVNAEYEVVCADDAVGRVSAEYITAYPPGIPAVVPGEVLSEEVIRYISELCEFGANIKSRSGAAPHMYSVLRRKS